MLKYKEKQREAKGGAAPCIAMGAGRGTGKGAKDGMSGTGRYGAPLALFIMPAEPRNHTLPVES